MLNTDILESGSSIWRRQGCQRKVIENNKRKINLRKDCLKNDDEI